jgi:hypothetical protein
MDASSARILTLAATGFALLTLACGGRDGTAAGGAAGPGGAPAGASDDSACAAVQALQGTAREEIVALARLLAKRPSMAIDMTAASGEYCLNTGGHVMAHWTARPDETTEDLIYFIDAQPLVDKGLRLSEFPLLGPDRGTMQPNTFYRYEGRTAEPHHGMTMSDRTWLVLSIDVE